ncbi:phage integrase [Acetobacter pasteurianus NBRC 101655]|uniref:site-specific integrase n=2 Tax=Acetobacter pasteurianus TaxID=438 RepID=UPI0002457511|nr:site-specific integrase [Acetobacter pasteurianus]BAU37244.1 phage integrase [Acetobacter pasteurianus NBRC 101655]CCT59728.1 integrase family protein [Acetobacter pasteurianus 386B]
MLVLVGTHYHFRRVVPVALRPLFGKTEFWISLKTGSKSEARLSAMALHAQTSALFRTARLMTDPARNKPITKDDLLALYQDIIKKQKEVIETNERHAAEQLKLERYRASMTRYEDLLKTRAFITYSSETLERLNQNMTRLRQDMITGTAQDKTSLARKTEEIDRLHATLVKLFQTGPALSQAPGAVPPSHQLASPTPTPTAPPSPRLTEALHLALLADSQKSDATKKETARTVALFVQVFGDKPVKEITGRVAGEFRDLLFSLPTSYAKGKQERNLNAEVERAQELDLPTLSGKSVKNHFMRLSALWNQLLRREIADKNPWSNWDFDLTKRNPRRAWTDDELALLSSSAWTCSTISQATFAGITLVAAYSGMRLGEICNLRNEDVQEVDGIPCFLIGPHPEDKWAPKTEAGTRNVPIHSALLDWGILDFRKNGEKFLFPELKTPKSGPRGTDFGRNFSKFKTTIGLPAAITFHSFRHTVSTRLRNQAGDLRELWIDALLGHEASHKSQGATTYLSGIATENLKQTVEAISYPTLCLRRNLWLLRRASGKSASETPTHESRHLYTQCCARLVPTPRGQSLFPPVPRGHFQKRAEQRTRTPSGLENCPN